MCACLVLYIILWLIIINIVIIIIIIIIIIIDGMPLDGHLHTNRTLLA